MDERDDYGYGWCERGKRFEAFKTGRRTGRVNMIAAYCERQLSAAFTVDGACNRVVFETWLETCLLPTLQPGQVVILDNAHISSWRSHCPTVGSSRLPFAVFAPVFARPQSH
jgi:hypothetical protein